MLSLRRQSTRTPARRSATGGFTLIEIMVAVSIFAIVSLISISALLTANNLNRKAQAIKLVMDNLNFALASMTLKMKQGGSYSCYNIPDEGGDSQYPSTESQDCPDGNNAIAFRQALAPNRRYIYRFHQVDQGDGSTRGRLEFAQGDETGSMGDFRAITAPEIDIKRAQFRVYDAQDNVAVVPPQPRILISLYGDAVSGQQRSDFAIQTSVSDRR